jgi:polysaccharide deacetylase family protein (PEP-CTERM system associated)
MVNALTFDIEDYYQVEAFKPAIPFAEWSQYPSRIVANTQKITDILDEHKVKATFFILGWIAERFPDLVKRLVDDGHEIASHGYAHQLVYTQSRTAFEADLVKSLDILERISGTKIIGYRAPTYSIIKETFWALDILIQHHLLYDSSIFPIIHDRYGVPDGKRFPHTIQDVNGHTLLEFPLSTLRFWKWNVPVAGGGYLRLLPYQFFKFALHRLNLQQQPGIIYLHPWELDPEQPRLANIPLSTRFRHYINLRSTATKLRKLLRDFEFAPIRDVLKLSEPYEYQKCDDYVTRF